MIDILLDSNGDIKVSPTGDLYSTESVRQAILIKLRWIYNEWRLGPDLGFPWFEEVFVKNPNIDFIKQSIRNKILEVDGVTEAKVTNVKYSISDRSAVFRYTATVGEETFMEEVAMHE